VHVLIVRRMPVVVRHNGSGKRTVFVSTYSYV
jgi:hypothetical protein